MHSLKRRLGGGGVVVVAAVVVVVFVDVILGGGMEEGVEVEMCLWCVSDTKAVLHSARLQMLLQDEASESRCMFAFHILCVVRVYACVCSFLSDVVQRIQGQPILVEGPQHGVRLPQQPADAA